MERLEFISRRTGPVVRCCFIIVCSGRFGIYIANDLDWACTAVYIFMYLIKEVYYVVIKRLSQEGLFYLRISCARLTG